MTKKEFMQRLKQLLPENDKRDILLDYEEHFLSGLTDGKTEEEIVAELGTPEEVAKEYGYVENASIKGKALAGVGLIFLDVILFISGFIFSIFAICLALWAIPFALFVASLLLIVLSFISIAAVTLPWYLLLTTGIALLAFSVLLGIGMLYLTKGFFSLIKWYYKLHVSAFSGN